VANAPADTKVKAVWIVVEADGVDSNQPLGEKELEGDTTFSFSLSNEQLWPTGTYKVELYLNDELDRSLEFEVEGEVAAQAATPEPEPTATPAPTTTPENRAGDTVAGAAAVKDSLEPASDADIILAEYFDSAANGWATGEFATEVVERETTIEDGRYTIKMLAKEPAYIEELLADHEFSDFILTVEATPRDSKEHYSYGVLFRLNTEGNAYLFEIGNDGLYTIQLFDGEWQPLRDWKGSAAIKAGQKNELMISADGSSLSFFVNGQLLTALDDNTASTGQIGLVVEIFEEGKSATIDFDNLIIRKAGAIELPQLQEPEALTFQATPYTHPSAAFSFPVPESWELLNEDETSVTIGDRQSLVGAIFVDAGFVYSSVGFVEFIDNFSERFISDFSDAYEVISQDGDPNDKVFLSTMYQSAEGDGNIDFLFMQRKTAVFILYFATTAYDDMLPTWGEIIGNYTFDPDAALTAAPAPTPVPRPTQPPAPAGPSVPAGKGVMLFRNNTGGDFVIDVIGPTNTSQVVPPQSSFEFVLEPGPYSINGHSPGGQYAINAYSFEIVAGQVFPINLN